MQIRTALREFEIDPWHGDIVKLGGEPNDWRRRVGNYRIFYSIHQKHRLVEIAHIKRRTSQTY
jgi:mRNA-degrading endonuclease RelE of RelBE toxin-antitoxin system